MGFRKLANNCGATMMELVLTVAMVATISAVTVPNYTRYLESTREKVCALNRQTILYEYQLYLILEPDLTLSDYIRTFYKDYEGQICPSGGSYTADGSGELAELTCSKHHEVMKVHGAKNTPSEAIHFP